MLSILMLAGGAAAVTILGVSGVQQIITGSSTITESSTLLVEAFATIIMLLPVIGKFFNWFIELLFIFPDDISIITSAFIFLWTSIWTWKLVKS